MPEIQIQKSTLQFLKNLESNNKRDWFNKNKGKYILAQENMIDFIDALLLKMKKHDDISDTSGKKSLFRIYKDVRFSKDKSPYSARFAFRFGRNTQYKRGGYYVHIKPGNSFLACGFFSPNPEDLKRIRQDIDINYEEWNSVLLSKKIKTNFGILAGEKVASAPRGYPIHHPAIDLLRHKQFILRHTFTDAEVLSPDFNKQLNQIFKNVRPYFDFMSDVLTTDLNGESIFKK